MLLGSMIQCVTSCIRFVGLINPTCLLTVRPQSGYFGGGAIGDMTEDVANDYMKRSTEMNA